jgi:hypothetical protein
MPRPLTSIVVLILTGVALAGCGGAGGHPATSALVTGHAGVSRQAVSIHPSQIGDSPTKAQATAFADAVNLTSADLPSFTGSPPKQDSQESEAESAELVRCAGVAWHPAVAEVSSENFKRRGPEGAEVLSSTVTVMGTAALAAQDVKAILSSRGEKCMENELNRGLAKKDSEQVNYAPGSVIDSPLEAPGVTEGFEFKAATNYTRLGSSYNIFVEVLGFRDGPVEVALTAIRDQEPVAPATVQHLLSVLVKRARERLHGYR